jgi:signal transduction histidine kinase
VCVDEVRVREALLNLVENSIKFMGNQPGPQIWIGADIRNDQPLFFVRDNGIGIEPEYAEKVFGLFEKLDPRSDGTGIGLALVQRIIEVHGGRVWVESPGVDQGTTIFFTLPVSGSNCLYEPGNRTTTTEPGL